MEKIGGRGKVGAKKKGKTQGGKLKTLNFNTYIHRVLKQVHKNTGITKGAMASKASQSSQKSRNRTSECFPASTQESNTQANHCIAGFENNLVLFIKNRYQLTDSS